MIFLTLDQGWKNKHLESATLLILSIIHEIKVDLDHAFIRRWKWPPSPTPSLSQP
jgi:hypothetical protein